MKADEKVKLLGRNEKFPEVFDEELELVGARRSTDEPVDKDLVGLAFSGGGIRSATFGLGVLEGMREFDVLKKVDYLSTVSGGGYIGAWLSANCKRSAERPTPVDWLDYGANWKPSVAHLRRYSNYLSPLVGLFSADTWSMATIWLRNTILVQFTVILAIAVLLLMPRLFFDAFVAWPAVGHWRWVTVAIFIVAIAGIAGNECRVNGGNDEYLHSRHWKTGLCAALLSFAASLWIGHCLNYEPFPLKPFPDGAVDWLAAAPIVFFLVFAGFCLLPPGVKFLAWVWRRLGWRDPPAEINYTQTWVQGAVVVPMLIAGFLLAAVLWGQSAEIYRANPHPATYSGYFLKAWRYWPLPLSVAIASLWLLSFWSIRGRTGAKGQKIEHKVWILAPFPAVVVLYALLCAIMLEFHGWAGLSGNAGAWRAFVWGPSLVLLSFSLTVVVLIGMLGRDSTEAIREWWSRLGAWLSIYGFAWMVIAVCAVYGPRWTALLLDSDTWKHTAIGGWLLTTLAGLFAGKSGSTSGKPKSDQAERTSTEKALSIVAIVGPYVFAAGVLIGISTCLQMIILAISNSYCPNLQPGCSPWDVLNDGDRFVTLAVLAAVLVCLRLMASRVDINEFSLNSFYRSRLSRCYLGATHFLPGERKPQAFTEFDENDDLPLADLATVARAGVSAGPPAGPLHIVNCALNLGGSSDLSMHTRHSASFALSPLATGSSYQSHDHTGTKDPLGYRSTAKYGGPGGHPTLAQAISVSGAAASPNMGYHTSPVVAFMLTIFNVRLGWWFPNPEKAITSPSPGFSLRYLVTELFGGADEKSDYLMISDGGHFENLAAYELIRRKCKVVIISDAECDRELKFEGMGSLIRMCAVDFGCTIDIDLSGLRLHRGCGNSALRWAIGDITYDDKLDPKGPSSGILIYLKASMTGREDTAIQQYKSTHPDFPHESTGDQFYGEDQFESYRRLGTEIAKEVFERVAMKNGKAVSSRAELAEQARSELGRFPAHLEAQEKNRQCKRECA